MTKLMTKIKNDTCPKCNKERSLELYDMQNYPVRFTFLLDTNQLDRLVNKKLSHFQCKRCKEVFPIDWDISKSIPKPLTDIKMSDFIRKYNLD